MTEDLNLKAHPKARHFMDESLASERCLLFLPLLVITRGHFTILTSQIGGSHN